MKKLKQTTWYMGGFLKRWYPTTMFFPTKNDHFRVFWGYPYFRKHPYISLESHGQIMKRDRRTAHLEDPAQLPRHAIVSCLRA